MELNRIRSGFFCREWGFMVLSLSIIGLVLTLCGVSSESPWFYSYH